MEFKKCSRCGSFYVSEGMVCPKCTPKDEFEFSSFKSYVERNGLNDSVDAMAVKTGISVKNLNRFLESNSFEEASILEDTITKNNINPTPKNNNGITFLI